MTQTVQYGTSFNPANTFVPDVYEQVVPPQAYFGGIPTSIAAVPGTASWGKLNSPVLLSNPTGMVQNYGGIVKGVSNLDQHDLCTDITQALNQAQGTAGLAIYGIRVSDGTDTAASLILYDGTTESITIGGTCTTGNVVNFLFTNVNLPGGHYNFQYAVLSGDTTPTLLATSIKAAINLDTTLMAAGIMATNIGAVITVSWAEALGGVAVTSSVNGTTTVTVTSGSSPTPGDIVTVTVTDANLVTNPTNIAYTVQESDTVTLIAAGLKALILASTTLAAIGVTATNSSGILSVKSVSTKQTTVSASVSEGATEAVAIGAGPTETATLSGQHAGITLTATCSGIRGNQIGVVLRTGSATGTVTVLVIPFPGGGTQEIYPNLPGDHVNFWPALQNALNNGISSVRGPSRFVVGSNAATTTNPPVLNPLVPLVLSGGTDGRGVTTGQLVGSPEPPLTGIYTLQRTQFPVSVMWVAGLDDTEIYSDIQAFSDQFNIFTLFTFPLGTSPEDAVTMAMELGISDYQIGYLMGWLYWYDQINGSARFVAPTATGGGAIAALPPWFSPCNVAVIGVLGTEETNPISGTQAYSIAQLNELGAAGIMTITNPVPGGNYFGFRNGFNSVGNNQPTAVVEYSRTTNYIVQSNGAILGPFVGKLQGLSSNDPLRAKVRIALNAFFQGLWNQNFIADWNVICDTTNNSPVTIGNHELLIYELITYMSSALYILTNVQGGTTVVANANQTGQQLTQILGG